MKAGFNFRRYHNKIYFPENTAEMVIEFIQQIDDIDVTNHAIEELSKDKRGVIPIPTKDEIFNSENTLVEFYERVDEAGNRTNIIQKLVIRAHNLSEKYDYCYVLAREGFIVSAWANDKNDIHRLNHKAHFYYNPNKVEIA